MSDYVKIIPSAQLDKHLICYVKRNLMSKLEESDSSYVLFRLSDFIIDQKTGTFIKCRYDLEYLLDNFKPAPTLVTFYE